jgi:hypothetical protein
MRESFEERLHRKREKTRQRIANRETSKLSARTLTACVFALTALVWIWVLVQPNPTYSLRPGGILGWRGGLLPLSHDSNYSCPTLFLHASRSRLQDLGLRISVADCLHLGGYSSASARVSPSRMGLPVAYDRAPNKITTLDAAMTLLFHVVAHSRGASEFGRSAKLVHA